MSSHYQRFMKILEKWPVDKSKTGRDLGEHLRKQAQLLIDPVNVTSKNAEDLNQQLDALERLAKNVHGNKYKRTLTSTATGLTAEQCNQALSSEFLYYMNEKESILSKNKKK